MHVIDAGRSKKQKRNKQSQPDPGLKKNDRIDTHIVVTLVTPHLLVNIIVRFQGNGDSGQSLLEKPPWHVTRLINQWRYISHTSFLSSKLYSLL